MKNTVHGVCLKIRAVQPTRRRTTGRHSQPLVSLEFLDRSLSWAKMEALKDDIDRLHTPLKTHP